MEMHVVHYKRDYGSLEEALQYEDGVAVVAFFFKVGGVRWVARSIERTRPYGVFLVCADERREQRGSGGVDAANAASSGISGDSDSGPFPSGRVAGALLQGLRGVLRVAHHATVHGGRHLDHRREASAHLSSAGQYTGLDTAAIADRVRIIPITDASVDYSDRAPKQL